MFEIQMVAHKIHVVHIVKQQFIIVVGSERVNIENVSELLK